MALSSSPTLQQLRRLDTSSLDFEGQLNNILYGEEYVQCVLNLREDDAAWLANYLDEALDVLDPSEATSRKCLRELRNICGTKGILPESYTLSSHLLDIRDEPFASGGHGEVYKGTHDGTGVCIKRLRVYAKDGLEKVMKAFCHEAVTWKRVTHPNIVPLLGVTISPRFQLISDYMSGGDLPEYIKQHSDADRLGLLSDVAKGLHYLHSCNVIHGDLKGSNILVDSSDHARIADFGLAMVTKNLDSVPSASHHHGYTPRWTAPEVLKDGKYSKEADIFSFAMVMYEVFAGAVPFNDTTSFMAMLYTTEGKRPPRPTHPIFTENLWTLMQRCWDHDPNSRPDVSEVLQILLNLDIPAWKQLITHTLAADRRVSLVTAIFSDHDQVKMIHGKCLRYLHRICGRHALLPRSLEIPLCYDPTKDPVSHGGLADVWKGQYQGECVAAQVFRLWPGDDTEKIKRLSISRRGFAGRL
ncbi:kinase-like domain-containing protein [Thelephora terrestris]|uniref:Kinase-like domain-containing protein n=1 Tax=Thelephora terrestris TaxID=56493 RepID=A0A9P6HKU6_9AGAM|nr:kinase-like domain-containing protein [Thelephora terrestris]